MPELSNIRDHVGWMIGRTVVDVTAGDPPDIPDADDEDSHYLIVHFNNGGTLTVPISDEGFSYFDPDRKDDE